MTSPGTRLAADSWRASFESAAICFNFGADSSAAGVEITAGSALTPARMTPDMHFSRASYCICSLDWTAYYYKKLCYRRETARQLRTSFSARSMIVHFTEHCTCCTTIYTKWPHISRYLRDDAANLNNNQV